MFSKTLMYVDQNSPVQIAPRARELLVGALAGIASREKEVAIEQDSVRPPRWVTVTVNEHHCTLNIERVDAPWTLRSDLQEVMRFVQPLLAPAAPDADPTERLLKVEIAATNGMLLALDGRSELLDVETYRRVRARLPLGPDRPTLDAGAVRPSTSADRGGALTPPSLSAESRRSPAGPVVGYLRLRSFGPGVSADLDRGLAGLETARVKGLVLDLRDNSGGLLDEAIKVADAFVKDGTLATMLGKERGQPQRKELLARNSGREPEGALVVLVNNRTGSGAELVAAAIKNLGRGIIMGEPTAGSASMRVAFDVSKGDLRVRSASPPRDPSRDVVQDIIDGKNPTAPPQPQPVPSTQTGGPLGLFLVTGTLLASGGAPIEGVGLVPDVRPPCLVGEAARVGDDCLFRLAQEAIVQARGPQRSALLSAAKAIAAKAQPPAAAP